MQILYRACPINSPNPPPVHAKNKYELIKMCLDSFMKAIDGHKITFILDKMHEDWLPLFEGKGEIIRTNDGNVGTFHKQLELARKMDKVFFVEDDYFWRPGTVKLIEDALDELDIISPYDHPSHYTEERFDKKYETRLINNHVYRTAPSNTLTFATHGRFINEYWPKWIGAGIADHELFQSLPLKIWNPTNSYATHMVKGLLAPNIEWNLQTK